MSVQRKPLATLRAWLSLAALVGLLLGLALWLNRGPDGERRGRMGPLRGDVVLFLVDTLRADRVGAYGHSRPTTPAVDALARRGALFEHAYAHSSWTLPSVASLVTGRYPLGHGARIRRDVPRLEHSGIVEDAVTLAQLFRRAGYRTGAFINNAFISDKAHFDRGFDHFDLDDGLDYRKARQTGLAALQWLIKDPRPTFLFVHFMDPHLPYGPPEHVRGRFTGDGPPPVEVPFAPEGTGLKTLHEEQTDPDYVKALYDEEILGVDQVVGGLVKLIDRRPGEPLYIFTSDHGEEFWDHGGFEHGHSMFGELTRVPLIVAGDPWLAGRVETPVGQVDLFQYLAAVTGAERVAGTEGTDLVTLADAERRSGPNLDRPILHDEVLYTAPLAALTQGHHRLIIDLTQGKRRIYQFADSGQYEVDVTNLTQPERVEALTERLRALRGHLEVSKERDSTAQFDRDEAARLKALGYGR